MVSFKLKDLQVCAAELVGTFYLAFAIAMTKNAEAGSAPMAIGFALVSAIYMTGPVSGGMVNPAVTISILLRNKLSVFEACYCIFSQILGALLAGVIAYGIYNNNFNNTGSPSVDAADRRGQAFLGETIQTFALTSTVLNVATATVQSNNSYYGVAIGFVVLSGALVIGGVTGACFNPAIAFLSALHQDWEDFWIFLLGPLVGGILAALVFRVTNPAEFDDSDPVLKMTHAHRNPDGNLSRTAAMLSQEFIGTFFWAWISGLGVNTTPGAATFAVGAIIVSMSYMGGSVSGAHYNPAVTLGVFVRGIIEHPTIFRATDCLLYMVVQILGAFGGAACASSVNRGSLSEIASPYVNFDHHTAFAGLACEFVFTFGLVLLSLSAGSTTEKVKGNSYFGLAIGFYIIAAKFAGGDVSGAAMNPAVAAALMGITQNHTSQYWIYFIGETLGAIAAAGVYWLWYYDKSGEQTEEGHKSNTHHHQPHRPQPVGSGVIRSPLLQLDEEEN